MNVAKPKTRMARLSRVRRTERTTGIVASCGPSLPLRAFTLMELMVVITLVAILSALLIPEMKGTFQEALLRSSSRDLINLFDLTYSRSVSLNQTRRVCFDERKGKYMVQKSVVAGGRDLFVPVDDPGCSGELDPKITMEFFNPSAMPGADSASSTAGSPPADGDQLASSAAAGVPEDITATISFYPDGTADPGVLELTDRDGFRLALKINPITARVQVEELERK